MTSTVRIVGQLGLPPLAELAPAECRLRHRPLQDAQRRACATGFLMLPERLVRAGPRRPAKVTAFGSPSFSAWRSPPTGSRTGEAFAILDDGARRDRRRAPGSRAGHAGRGSSSGPVSPATTHVWAAGRRARRRADRRRGAARRRAPDAARRAMFLRLAMPVSGLRICLGAAADARTTLEQGLRHRRTGQRWPRTAASP